MENQASNQDRQSEEIDLGQLFQFIGRGFSRLFRGILKIFLYLKKNAVKFGILIIAGFLVGFGLNQIITKQLKSEVIVKPNLESKTYLYDVVDEINANIKTKNTTFFGELEIDIQDLEGFLITIEPIETEEIENMNEQVKYLELLDKFREEEGVLDVVRTEILNKSAMNQRITFFYKEEESGSKIASKLMEYINSNDYFNQLIALHNQNATERISKNNDLVKQIDQLISGYTLDLENEARPEGTLILSEAERLNVPGLLRLKKDLIKETELKKLEIQGNEEAIRIISFGKTQEVHKSFFGKTITLIPTLLVGLFLLIDLTKYLNRKASELQTNE